MIDNSKPKSAARLGLEIAVVTIVGVFLAGVVAGYLDGHGTASMWRSIAVVSVIGAVLGANTLLLWRYRGITAKLSQRQRNYWLSFAIAVVVGVVLGISSQFSSNSDSASVLADPFGQLAPSTSYLLGALWVIGMGGSLIFYHRGVDDHEERAWLWAGLAGWYAFILPTPLWFILARADILPPVDVLILLIFSMLVNAIVWLWLKFR